MASTMANTRVALAALIGLVIFVFFLAALFPGAVTSLLGINTSGWTTTMLLLWDFIIIVIFLVVILLILQLIGLKIF